MARNLGRIEDRLAAAIRYNVIYGDRGERSIMEGQVVEAIEELRLLRSRAAGADKLEAALREIRDNTTEPVIHRIAREALGDAPGDGNTTEYRMMREPDPAEIRWECSACGWSIFSEPGDDPPEDINYCGGCGRKVVRWSR